jgi:hypothetical protein
MSDNNMIGEISAGLAEVCNDALNDGAEPRDVLDALLSCLVAPLYDSGLELDGAIDRMETRFVEIWANYAAQADQAQERRWPPWSARGRSTGGTAR